MARLQIPVFYANGIRQVDRLCRQLVGDARVSEADKQAVRELASKLITIMAQTQSRQPKSSGPTTGNA